MSDQFPVDSEPALMLPYTSEESDMAARDWNASCGPHAIAAATGRPLDEVRKAIEAMAQVTGYAYKGWMNPTQVSGTLAELGVENRRTSGLKTMAFRDGINRIQWEGPWLKPGVPKRVAYFQTHYVAYRVGWVLCTACVASAWIREEVWRFLTLETGTPNPFHITHTWEFEPKEAG